MPLSQNHINSNTPMGANLVSGGATFKVWAPGAKEVYLLADFNNFSKNNSSLLTKNNAGYWTGFQPGINDGDQYEFYIKGNNGEGRKRDPYARELTLTPQYPESNCIVRDPHKFKWHDQHYKPPFFNDYIIYQLHIGTYYGMQRENRVAKFLDVLYRIDYLVSLGVNAIEPLPVVEFSSPRSLGYDGSDLFSPEMDYFVDPGELGNYSNIINDLYSRKGITPPAPSQFIAHINQLKILIDICHLYGIAVIFDLVYNHAGGDIKNHSESLWFYDFADGRNDPNNSLYFTPEDHTGPVFAFWRQEVRQFLIDNAVFFINEYHIDGIRYDQVSVIVKQNANDGWKFCQDLSGTVRDADNSAIQAAEFWSVDPWVVKDKNEGGAGFDSCWHDGLRISIRNAVDAASSGSDSFVDMEQIARNLYPFGFTEAWRAVQCIESHDEVYFNRARRIPSLADKGNSRSWYARSRARAALGILLTAPGIPMIFMGQEFLEDKQWSDNPSFNRGTLIWWEGLEQGDKSMSDYLRFTQELIRLRINNKSLRSDNVNTFHINNSARVLAYHRWDYGEDIVVVVSLNDNTIYDYYLGFPHEGRWSEIFNSDVYDNWVNPILNGNSGAVFASINGMHGFSASAKIVIPANSVVVFKLG